MEGVRARRLLGSAALLALTALSVGQGCAGLASTEPQPSARRGCSEPTGPALYGYWERNGIFTAALAVGAPGVPGYDRCSGQWARVAFERPPWWPAGDFCIETWALNAKEVPTSVHVDPATGWPRGVLTSYGIVAAPNGHSILSLRVDVGSYHWPVQFANGDFPIVTIQNSQDYGQVMYVSMRGRWGRCP